MERGKSPPCDTCYVELMPENEQTFYTYGLVRNQINITGMGDVIGLDYNSVISTIKLYDIANPRQIFEDIIYLFNEEQKIADNIEIDRQ